MVYDVSTEGKEKKARKKGTGKLIGIQSDSSKCKVFDPETGKYSWIRLSLVTGKNKEGEDKYLNVTAYEIDFEHMPELQKADQLLRDKKKPLIELEYYESQKAAVVDGKPIMVEDKEMRDGKEVIVQKPKIYINYRMTKDDVVNSLKILEEDMKEEAPPTIEEEAIE